MTDVERVERTYRSFADHECRGYSDHYAELSRDIAADDWLCRFISDMPEIQPNLFLASIQFLTGPQEMPRTSAGARSVVQARQQEVIQLMLTRRTQTNEVGRCASVLPALPAGPLALIEVGASAGLCLLLDELAYDFGATQLGQAAAPIKLQCKVTGNPPWPSSLPEVPWRAGLDLSPLDVNNPADANWLLACVWPDHQERRARTAAAIELAKRRRISVRQGDLAQDLPALLEEVPSDLQLVIFHSAVLAYNNEEQRQAFVAAMSEASRHRDIVWISNEGPSIVPEITRQAPDITASRFLLGRTWFCGGERRDEFLGVAHPHGATLEWLSHQGRQNGQRL